jgi:multisubunit Na+/H+ antiporter MnhB subunit
MRVILTTGDTPSQGPLPFFRPGVTIIVCKKQLFSRFLKNQKLQHFFGLYHGTNLIYSTMVLLLCAVFEPQNVTPAEVSGGKSSAVETEASLQLYLNEVVIIFSVLIYGLLLICFNMFFVLFFSPGL